MKLTINGEPREIEAATVAEALAALDMAEARVATALNGAFVPAAARDATPVTPGDALEIVAPMQGG
ncbi:sulfur carrier protein ThiS [Paracoccus sp. Z118]|uniref:sulfur carrier protein ThiS n=1 Tax=Paracoccus sp. Z118 TaxID=2851017 RepID=UPI001C2C7930|nr:sulfur carrier protein ThiS [Paracoccus sp. Z118]MBV0891170.1 sulfur carrier protein ThiS [Paracoccus sp. Z118]